MSVYNNLEYNEDFTVCKGFLDKKSKTAIFHPNTKVIAERAFEYNKYLEEVYFNDNLKVIQKFAFSFCENLKNIDLSNTKIKTLETGTFYCCINLESVKLPVTLEKIKSYCIISTKIKELILPPSMEYINYEFKGLLDAEITLYTNNKFKKLPDTVTIKPFTLEMLIEAGCSFKDANKVINNPER